LTPREITPPRHARLQEIPGRNPLAPAAAVGTPVFAPFVAGEVVKMGRRRMQSRDEIRIGRLTCYPFVVFNSYLRAQ